MSDILSFLGALRRPKILVRAARAGVLDYRRDRDLKRLLRGLKLTTPQDVIEWLIGEEIRLEKARLSGDATYSVQRHVIVLTAMIGEARHLTGLETKSEIRAAA